MLQAEASTASSMLSSGLGTRKDLRQGLPFLGAYPAPHDPTSPARRRSSTTHRSAFRSSPARREARGTHPVWRSGGGRVQF